MQKSVLLSILYSLSNQKKIEFDPNWPLASNPCWAVLNNAFISGDAHSSAGSNSLEFEKNDKDDEFLYTFKFGLNYSPTAFSSCVQTFAHSFKAFISPDFYPDLDDAKALIASATSFTFSFSYGR